MPGKHHPTMGGKHYPTIDRWSGLTATDARAGLELAASHLFHEVVDSQAYWFSNSLPLTPEPSQEAFLLPTYDEFLVGFAKFDETRRGGRDSSEMFNSMIVVAGRIAGSWRRTFEKGAVIIHLAPFDPLTSIQDEAVTAAAQRYAEFLEMPVVLRWIRQKL